MNHADLVALIQDGVARSNGGRWVDLGAGDGAFTFALADILGDAAHVTAVDRDAGSMRGLASEMGKRFPAVHLEAVIADFTRRLPMSDLDGVLMANSLHFVRDKRPVLGMVREMLRPGGRLVIVEYGADRGNPWVPHPFSYATWEKLAAEAGFEGTRLLRTIPSRFLGSLYSSATNKPLAPRSVTS